MDGTDIVLDVVDELYGQDVVLRAVACFQSQTSTRNIPDIFLLYILHKYAQILEEMEMIAVPITVRYFLCLLACVS